jgi:hypothetical protein
MFPENDMKSEEDYRRSFLDDFPLLEEYVRGGGWLEEFYWAYRQSVDREDQHPELLSLEAIQNLSPEEIHSLCLGLWVRLPQKASIHRSFFIKLCGYCSLWNTWEMQCDDPPDELALDSEEILELNG